MNPSKDKRKKSLVGWVCIERHFRPEHFKDRRIVIVYDKRPVIIPSSKCRVTIEELI